MGRMPVALQTCPVLVSVNASFATTRKLPFSISKKKVDKPEDRYAWSREANTKLLKLERDVFVAGYPKTFLLFMDTCYFCKDCVGTRSQCLNTKYARPTPEVLAVDVFSTVKQVGYPIEVLSDYSQKMNRYAFLMIE
jgi:predicted metal-binding protein